MTLLVIVLVMAALMLTRDALWSATTAQMQADHWVTAALLNSASDGVSGVTGYVTSLIGALAVIQQAPAATQAGHLVITTPMIASVLGDMLGAFMGIIGGHFLSHYLDALLPWWHTHPVSNHLKQLRTHMEHSAKVQERLSLARQIHKLLLKHDKLVDNEAFASLMRREQTRIAAVKDLQGT